MNYYTELYYTSCVKLGLKPEMVPGMDGFKVHIANRDYFYRETLGPLNNVVTSGMSNDRFSVNRLLKQAGLPVPSVAIVTKPLFLKNKCHLEALNYPVVAKPAIQSSHGYHVVCNIRDKENAHSYLKKYFQVFDALIFEEYLENLKSYEIFVVYQHVMCIIERTPASVTGDGKHSVKELIQIENQRRAQRPVSDQKFPFQLNEETFDIFNQLNIRYESILPEGQKIPLRYCTNTVLGGDFKRIDIESIHPSVIQAVQKAVDVLDLNFASINILSEDIRKPLEASGGRIVSVNPNPCIIVNHIKYQGKDIQLCDHIVKQHKIRRQWALVKSWLTYPLLTLSLTFLMSAFIMFIYWLHSGS